MLHVKMREWPGLIITIAVEQCPRVPKSEDCYTHSFSRNHIDGYLQRSHRKPRTRTQKVRTHHETRRHSTRRTKTK